MTCHGFANGCVCPKCHARNQHAGVRTSANKDVRQFIRRQLYKRGWHYAYTDSQGHPRFWHPDHEDAEFTLPSTPSSEYWLTDAFQRLAKYHPDVRQPGRKGRRGATVTEITVERRIIDHANGLGITLTFAQARALIARYKHPRKALDRMARAAMRQQQADVIDLQRWRTNDAA